VQIASFAMEKIAAPGDDVAVVADPESPAESDRSARPRLTVSILTKNSADRLERLLAEVSWIADQVVVGVDVDSTDSTAQVAARFADVVFTFRKAGPMAGPRMMIFDYAVGDWILVIDDDESLEAGFQAILPELLSRQDATHYWFPRKWIVNAAPYEFAASPPWYPDWQMRLFRNDRTMAWKPATPHSGYRVLGAGYFEPRAGILHFEPIWCDQEARRTKVEHYRRHGAPQVSEAQYPLRIESPRRPATGPAMLEHNPDRVPQGVVHPEIRQADDLKTPAWSVEILRIDIQEQAECGAQVVAEILVRNTGDLAWTPAFGDRGARLGLGVHLLDGAGGLIQWDYGGRLPVRQVTPPGAETTFIHAFTAPDQPGDFRLAWNLVDDDGGWFSDDPGSAPPSCPLRVVRAVDVEDREFLQTVTHGIAGRLGDEAALLTLHLMRRQTARGVAGPALEIGVHAGRYLSILHRGAWAGGDATLGLDSFERIDEAQVRANLAGIDGALDLVAGRSVEHDADGLRARLAAPIRFASIDGSPLLEDAAHDLALCDALLADQGVVACEDFLNPTRLGVCQAVNQHLASGEGLAAFAYVQNKLFLCRPAAHRDLFEAVMEFFAREDQTPAGAVFAQNARSRPERNQTLFQGWDVVVVP
jgi:hypothetical protein